MAVFRVEKNSGYTVMSNHHLRNRALSLKAKGLLSQMLSLPEDWDYTLQGLARINRESIDAIRQAIRELEQAGYIQRSRERDEKGRLRGADYVIFELPQPVPASVSPTLENPTLENPTQENPTLENPMQLNKDKLITEKQKKEGLNTDSIPIHSPNPLPLDEDEAAAPPPERTGSRKETAYQIYRDLILENIEYDTLTQNPRIDREQLDEVVDILLETVCTNRKSIRVAGDDYPAELVKAKFLKLDSHHIEFVMDCLRDNTTKVRNIKQRRTDRCLFRRDLETLPQMGRRAHRRHPECEGPSFFPGDREHSGKQRLHHAAESGIRRPQNPFGTAEPLRRPAEVH